jgi:hypothetical protein
MLEAVATDLASTISLKRSTQNLQLSTSWAGRLPHLFQEQTLESLIGSLFGRGIAAHAGIFQQRLLTRGN